MAEEHEPLILDLVEWIAAQPRPYFQVMDAWRTSCPRLPVWEDAVDRGFVERQAQDEGLGGAEGLVRVTPAGLAYLKQHGRAAQLAG